ncbi:L-arabinose transporter permease protein [mine drainage metagenome]|uniref:L-arabinose transporter permease protein n=1 Tax=mine drainage metagenome TaxID=410659 RepID=A0A1J5QBT7_9ZZZZ
MSAEAKVEASTDQPQRRDGSRVVLVSGLSVILAMFVGGALIALSDPEVTKHLSHPLTFLKDAVASAAKAYYALFQGAIFDSSMMQAGGIVRGFNPLSETIVAATPLLCAGLAVALAFRAGLFNIGAQGQIIFGAICSASVGFMLSLPVGIHLLVAVVAGIIGGAFYGGLAGFLKARTGAHEVIVTIMLNYIALNFLGWLLSTRPYLRHGRNDPISPPIHSSAAFPLIAGSTLRVNAGIFVALAAAVFVGWLLNRTTLGFKFRAVGANSSAARTAGISVSKAYIGVMLISGGLAGLGGATQVLGTERSLTGGIAASLGFDAITVALLGRGSPLGTVLSALLFGALKAGGLAMQAKTGTPLDIVLVIQALVVLFIAAPALVRAVFRLKEGGASTLSLSKGWNG